MVPNLTRLYSLYLLKTFCCKSQNILLKVLQYYVDSTLLGKCSVLIIGKVSEKIIKR